MCLAMQGRRLASPVLAVLLPPSVMRTPIPIPITIPFPITVPIRLVSTADGPLPIVVPPSFSLSLSFPVSFPVGHPRTLFTAIALSVPIPVARTIPVHALVIRVPLSRPIPLPVIPARKDVSVFISASAALGIASIPIPVIITTGLHLI